MQHQIREDAVQHDGRYIVPTGRETKFVSTWEEFKLIGGTHHFNEDQTSIELHLPTPYKFSIKFQNP